MNTNHKSAEEIIEQTLREAYYANFADVKLLAEQAEANSVFKDIFDKPGMTEHFLESGNTEEKRYAIQVMDLPWRDKERFAEACVHHFDDSDAEVSCYALYGISKSIDLKFFEGRNNFNLVRRLIVVIRDKARPLPVRSMAYSVLQRLFGQPGNYVLEEDEKAFEGRIDLFGLEKGSVSQIPEISSGKVRGRKRGGRKRGRD